MLVIFTVGTAASGKSTWARSVASSYPGLRIAIVERDAVRVALHMADVGTPFSWSNWNRSFENRVQWLWEKSVQDALPDHDVIILADTHLDLSYMDDEVAWLRGLGIMDMVIQYFPALPLVGLIRRDQGRPNFVGAAVLREHVQKLLPEECYWVVLDQRLADASTGSKQSMTAANHEKRSVADSVL